MSNDRAAYRRRQAATSSYDPSKAAIEASFNENNPSYAQVYKDFDFTTKYKVQIMNDRAHKGDVPQKKMLAYPGDSLHKGDIIHWKSPDDYWIVFGIDNQYDKNVKGIIKQCSDSLLKWKDQYGVLHVLPCVVTDAIGNDIANDKVVWAIDDKIKVFTQYGHGIQKGTRFILWDQVFMVTGFSRLGGKNNRSVIYNMDITENRPEDDFENGIAYNSWTHNVWSIEVLNSPISLVVGNTMALDVIVKNDGAETIADLVYVSNNPSIATVDSSGVVTGVAEGTTSIKISLSSNQSVFTTVNVEVAEVASDNYAIILVNPDGALVDNEALTITIHKDLGRDAYLTVQEYNNGTLVNTVFTSTLTFGSAFVSVTKTGDNTLTLSPIAVGNASLKIEDAMGHSVIYTIYVRTMF